MKRLHPLQIIGLGFLLVVLGFILPVLMVMQLIEPNLLLSFLSHAASVSGLFLGLIGTALYTRGRRK